MADRVVRLVADTDLHWTSAQIIDLTKIIESDFELGYDKLVKLDEKIGGVGLHNVHHPIGGGEMSGNYRIEFRPQFRPIQYVYQKLSYDDLAWTARDIVLNSCLHVEYALKLRFHIPENSNESLGLLLNSKNNKRKVEQGLDPKLLNTLNELNRLVYREAKHSIEHITLDGHNFAPADAIGIYLICRWIGVQLLKPTGIFDRWMRQT